MSRDERWLDSLVRERTGSLDQAEREQLDQAARGSVSLRAAMLAHEHFEERGAVQKGDDKRCQDIADQVQLSLGWRGASLRPRRSRRLVRVLVPAFFFATGAAAAAVAAWRFLPDIGAPATHETTSTIEGRNSVTQSPTQGVTPDESAPATESGSGGVMPESLPRADERAPFQAEPSGSGVASNNAGSSRTPAVTRAPAPLTAEQLFAQASREKSGGDWSGAARSYQQLAQRFPNSKYAGVAEMALGKRALSAGRAQSALGWFNRYQRRSSRPLMAEALWGEAQALEALGRGAEAKAVRRELERRYPKSPYAAQQ